MGQGDNIGVDLPGDVVIFRELAAFSRAFEDEGRRLHVVGGIAVTIWGLHADAPRPGTTSDIDSVITSAVMAEDIARYARTLTSIIAGRGYARPEGWEQSRAGRFRYVSDRGVSFEILCGTPTTGGASGTPPAHRLYRDRDSGLTLYAAKIPWLDLIERWVRVDVTCGKERFALSTPGVAGLAVLKIGAIHDKQRRIGDARRKGRPEAELERELARLAQHASDLVLLRDMLESLGELPELAALCREHPRMRSVAGDAAAWFDDHESDHAAIVRRQSLLRGSPDRLQHALLV